MLRMIATALGEAFLLVGTAQLLALEIVYFIESKPDLAPLFVLILYPLPIFVAAARRHNAVLDIMIFNLWLGWTVIGWIAVLVWACNWNVETPIASAD
jgi:hypothetical protein